MEKVRNPTTGRSIQVGGDVYNKLIAQGYHLVRGQLVATTVVPPPPPTPVVQPGPRVYPPIPGPIPNVETLDVVVQQQLREEEAQRQRACGICQEYYLNRYVPFTVPELNNLRAIARHCSDCGRLCDQQYYRRGIVNPPQCTQYKTAGIQATNQVQRLEHQAINEAMRRDLAAGKDVTKYFPTVPN